MTASMGALFASPVPSLYEPTVPVTWQERPKLGAFDVFDCSVVVPPARVRPTPRLRQLLERLRELTGWSKRTTALALKTTHPTVSSILSGHRTTTSRLPELPGRLIALVDLTERLSDIVDGDIASVNTALTTVPLGRSESALDLLRNGDLGRAYTTALDVLQPPRRAGMMMSSLWPAVPGEATAALDDEPG
ncbi:MAG: hypothetical protein LC808_31545 [Actinobacteria bacterium]|nr:hypothetical protein [Actinomycetota bacterium]